MPTIDEIRRVNLDRLADEVGGNLALANLVGVTESQMTQWRKGSKNSGTGKARGMRLASCHRIEDKTGKPRGWLDTLHDDPATVGTVGALPPAAAPALSAALPVVLDALAAIPALRWPAVQATMAQAVGHPEMRDDLAVELLRQLQTTEIKQRPAA